MSKEAMKLALEALKSSQGLLEIEVNKAIERDAADAWIREKEAELCRHIATIKALEEALAKQEQGEPYECVCGANLYIDANGVPRSKASIEPATVMFKQEQGKVQLEKVLRYEPEIFREDRIRMELDQSGEYADVATLIATRPTPPQSEARGLSQQQRKPLTWEQQMRIHNECGDSISLAIALTEAAHGITASEAEDSARSKT
jgi:post-segregation antitoxin (ccd killing protein)